MTLKTTSAGFEWENRIGRSSTCGETGKRQFETARAARKALTGQLKAKRVRVYACEFCGFLHLTTENTHQAQRDLR